MKGLLRNVVALFFGEFEAHEDNMLEDPYGSQKRICAHQDSIKKTCELAFSIVPHYTKDITGIEGAISDLMGKVKELDFAEFSHTSTTVWLARQVECLRFVRASIAVDET